jgi:hypothetical protein
MKRGLTQDLVRRQFEFNKRDTRFFEQLQEANLAGQQEHQTAALALTPPCRSSDAMNVIPRVIRGVKLNDPIDLRNIQATGRNIRTNQRP